MYENIDTVIYRIEDLKNRRKEKIKPILKVDSCRPSFNLNCFREAAIYRFIELCESTYQLYKSNLLVGSVVSARSAQETLAVIWYIDNKIDHFLKTKDLQHLIESLKRLSLGWCNDEEFPEKVNILTCIGAVDKVLDGKFRRHYDMLSEYAHPNYSGTLGVYSQANLQTTEVTFGCNLQSQKTLTSHIESTLIICISLLLLSEEKYTERMEEVLALCLKMEKSDLDKVFSEN